MHKLIGHRGIRNHAPENTAKGFDTCAKYFDWVEFDATLTKDEHVVIFHDEYLHKKSNGVGKIGDITLAELSKFTVQGEAIPTLRDSIIQMQKLGLNMNLEIKDNDSRWQLLTDKVIEIVEEVCTDKTKILFSSFNHDALVYLRSKCPDVMIGHLFEEDLSTWKEQAEKVKPQTVHFWHRNILEDTVKEAKSLGYGVYVYTVNDISEYDILMRWGVDGVFTDEKPETFV